MYQLHETQWLPVERAKLWDFVSDPRNLSRITPPAMDFRIRSSVPERVHAGLMIEYRVRPLLRIPVTWVTEITHVEEGRYFVDEQRVGPYAMWHHEHHLEDHDGGTHMTDIVSYRLPLGPLGPMAHGLFVKRKLDAIFRFRKEAMERIFPEA